MTQVGDYHRAEAVARAITDPVNKAQALTGLVTTLTDVGDDRAEALAAETEALARDIADSSTRALTMIRLVNARTPRGDRDQAWPPWALRTLAELLVDPDLIQAEDAWAGALLALERVSMSALSHAAAVAEVSYVTN